MFDNRWQMITRDVRTDRELRTTEMPDLAAWGLPGLGYRFESCMFEPNGDSDVLRRYDTIQEAEAGHHRLVLELMQHQPAIGAP